jgi:uncharacterized protein YecT (DUF1311 family)
LNARSFAIPIIIVLAATPSAHAIDKTGAAETNTERARNAMNRCLATSASQIEVGNCYLDIARRLAIKTKRAIEDRETTPEASALLRSSTIAWGRIMALECDQRTRSEFAGGSGQGTYQTVCEINTLAARLDIMRISPD